MAGVRPSVQFASDRSNGDEARRPLIRFREAAVLYP